MSKREQLIEKLRAGWVSVPDLMASNSWKPHTLRGVISTLGTRERLKVERQRIEGVTSYRIAPEA